MKSKAAAIKRVRRTDDRRQPIDEATIRDIAKKCVYLIRGCLREEEWIDAEEEFSRIIAEGLARSFNC